MHERHPDSRVARVAIGIRTDCRSLRNYETRGSTLSVMAFSGVGNVGSRTHPRERRHNDSIRKLECPELPRTEERFYGHCEPLTLAVFAGWLEKRDLAHVDSNEQRLFHKLVIAFIRVHSTLGRDNDSVDVTVVRRVVETGGAGKNIHCVVVPAQ